MEYLQQSLRLKNAPAKILVIAMRYLGDLLLTTPLIHTLKKAYPNAQVDVLVYGNTVGMLEGNPDITKIIASPLRPKFAEYKYIVKTIFRQYDLAVSTQTGDRRFIYSLLAASTRISFVPLRSEKGWWKRFFMQGWVEFNNQDNHTVLEFLKLATLLDLPLRYALVPPKSIQLDSLQGFNLNDDYVVLHLHPQWTYKQWHKQGWIDIADHLNQQGLKIILSGGAEKRELDYIAKLLKVFPEGTINLAGKKSLADICHIIAHARLFIGPDTGTTHMAAAAGVPVIALFGSTNPIKWAPWPKDYTSSINPFNLRGSQQVHNIYLIQGIAGCVPCDLEGCDRHRLSRSRCLDSIPAARVIKIIDLILARSSIRGT